MNLLHLPAGPKPPESVWMVVEIPKGGRAKYEYDAKLGAFRLDRVLHSAVQYPAAYGFVPSTCAPDGDPTDILAITQEPLAVGSVLEARPVGLLRMEDEKGTDEKILAVAVADPLNEGVRELGQITPHFLREMEHFFTIYKDLEGSKRAQTFGWEPKGKAFEVIKTDMKRFVERNAAPEKGKKK